MSRTINKCTLYSWALGSLQGLSHYTESFEASGKRGGLRRDVSGIRDSKDSWPNNALDWKLPTSLDLAREISGI